MLAERFGGRHVVGLSMAAATILTGFFPVAAHFGYWWCYAVRVVIGIVGVSSKNLKKKTDNKNNYYFYQ